MTSTVNYEKVGRVAYITLNRPDRLNAIGRTMPQEIRIAVEKANLDDSVHAIVLTGAGRAFCAGYDLQEYAQKKGNNAGSQGFNWDPMVDYKMMGGNTNDFMSLWRSEKPTIAKVRGFAVAGGSDIALCCDIVVIAEDAKIGYPPARVWGVPTTAMWVHRGGAEVAKRMLLTGDLVSGKEAKEMGLVAFAVPENQLDAKVDELVTRISSIPKNQLMMNKMMINQAIDLQGLPQTQLLATMFDGIARHSPEGFWFKEQSEQFGYKNAINIRDSGKPFAENVSKPSVDRRIRTSLVLDSVNDRSKL